MQQDLWKKNWKSYNRGSRQNWRFNYYLLEIFKNHKIIKIFQKENYEFKRTEHFINELKNKVVKIETVLVRASPIMETLTGIMIAGLIFYAGKLILKEELDINNFFRF